MTSSCEVFALGFELGEPAGEAFETLAEVVVLMEGQRGAQGAELAIEFLEGAGLGGLTLHEAEAALGGIELFAGADEVGLGAFELALGFDLAGLVLGDAGGFLEDDAAFLGAGQEHGVDLALLDDAVGVGADAGVHEELADVAEAGLFAVDEVFAGAVAVEAAFDFDLVGVDGEPALGADVVLDGAVVLEEGFLVGGGGAGGERGCGGEVGSVFGGGGFDGEDGHFVVIGGFAEGRERRRTRAQGSLERSSTEGVVEGEGDAGHAEGLAAGGTGEDDVEHLGAAEGFAGAFAQDPLDGVDDVGLAAAIGADDAGDGFIEGELGTVGEGLEA